MSDENPTQEETTEEVNPDEVVESCVDADETAGSPPVDDGLPAPDAQPSPDLSALTTEDDQGNSGEAGVTTEPNFNDGSMTLDEAIKAREAREFHKE